MTRTESPEAVPMSAAPAVLTAPHVSVVIPTYNCAASLAAAIDSVIGQTYARVEPLVVDDGSTDDTAAVLARYGSRITVLALPHRGVSAARNAGLLRATGDLIAFLDADDIWEAQKLERQIEFFRLEPRLDVCFTDYAFFGEAAPHGTGFEDARDNVARLEALSVPVAGSARLIVQPRLLEHFIRYGTNPCLTSTVVVRRTSLSAVGLFADASVVTEDIHLWLRLAKRSTFGYLGTVLVSKRTRRPSEGDALDAHERWIFASTIHMLETLGAWIPLSDDERRAAARRAAQYRAAAGYFEFSRDRLGEARRHFWASLRRHVSVKAIGYLMLSTLSPRALGRLGRVKRVAVRAWGGRRGPAMARRSR